MLTKFGRHRHCGRGDYHVTSYDFVFRESCGIMGVFPPTKFGDHRSCGRGDIKLLVCHVISRDYVVRVI